MTPVEVSLLAAVGVAALCFGGLLLVIWLYNRREKRRKAASASARLWIKWGLEPVAERYEMYAVGDYSGLVHKLVEDIVLVQNDSAMVAKLEACVLKVLAYWKANDPAKVQEALKALGAAVAAAKPAVTAT